MMKAQDILIALKIQSLQDQPAGNAYSQRQLAYDTGLSVSQVNASVRRLEAAGLLSPSRSTVITAALREFLVHGLKYVFPVKFGDMSRGMPTGYAAEPLKGEFLASETEPVPVWPDPKGSVRGIALQPLYKSVPMAAMKDQKLYEYLALVDAIRGGRARERSKAVEILTKRLR